MKSKTIRVKEATNLERNKKVLEVCLGLNDFKMTQIATTIDCTSRLWNG